MHATRFLPRLSGFMHGKRRLPPDPSPVLLGLAGFDGKLKFLNSAWEKILGYPAQELLERPLRDLMQQHGRAAVALVERLLAEDSFEPLEFGLRCQDGTCRWFLWHRRFDSEHQAIFLAGYDITEQKSRAIAPSTPRYEDLRGLTQRFEAPSKTVA
jgi:PAS domain S-box-containing protein